jgi:alkanesulfonate monooxygenase SsuD/methylene tetrahydromethanopterin reductase-like flavin-dependent oxidoreductase (luciferase family)
MLGVNVFAADTDQEAKRHFTSVQQAFANLRRGVPGQVPPPIDNIDSYVSPLEKAGIDQALLYSFVGTPDTIERGLRVFIAATKPDELMLTGHFYDHSARLRSFELAAEVRRQINEAAE